MNPSNLPRFFQDILASRPLHGEGVHQWLFSTSCRLNRFFSPEALTAMLAGAVADCGRYVPIREIQEAVANSYRKDQLRLGPSISVQSAPTATKWPAVDVTLREEILRKSRFELIDLLDSSPTRVGLQAPDTEWILDQLYPEDPLLCVAASAPAAFVARKDTLQGKAQNFPLIVPSPMSSTRGRRKGDGKETNRCLDNTGPRRFLVTEFDFGSLDEQSAVIHHLSDFAPLSLVVWSGGKSLHAWWNCRDQGDEVTGRFMHYAVGLGADPATWCRAQLVRMPGGMRKETSQQQTVYYFDHGTMGETGAVV